MPAPFFVFRDAGGWESGCRDTGRNLGISGYREVFGISGGGGCVGAAMRASVWRGKEGARSEDCPVLGRLLGTRKTAGHSEDCWALGRLLGTRRIAGRSEGGRGACGSLCVFRVRLVNAWAGSWSGIAGGEGLLAANCRGRRGGVCREEGRLRVRAWDAWRRFVWQESRWMQGRGCACGVLPVVRESGMKPGGGVPAFVGS